MEKSLDVVFPGSWKNPESPGYGTYPGPYGYQQIERHGQGVTKALNSGYRHIDTAQAYDNETYVGLAIRASAVPRKSIFLTSKLLPQRNSYEAALEGIRESNQYLATFPDLYLVHYPGEGCAIEAWKGLIESKANGYCKHIGVSNFEITPLITLIDKSGTPPAVNQVEIHPHLWSDRLSELIGFCHKNNIQVEGYSPFAENKTQLLNNSVIHKIAKHHNCSTSRIILKWCMQHGVRPIVGSLDPEHISDNIGPYHFTLSSSEMAEIDNLGKKQFRVSLSWGWDPTSVTSEMITMGDKAAEH